MLVFLPYLAFYNNSLYTLNYPFPYPWRLLVPRIEQLVATIGLSSLAIFLFTFPDGHFQPRRLKRIAQVFFFFFILILMLTGWLSDSTNPVVKFLSSNGWIIFSTIYLLLLLIGICGQVYRYLRLSSPAQKQQTKWIFFSMLANLGAVVFASIGIGSNLRFGAAAVFSLVAILGGPLVISLIPLSLAFSVLRYRLWDIDVIIRRTLVYSALTGALSLLYFGGVAVSQGLLTANRNSQTNEGAIDGQPSAVVIVVTTMAIAALFNPLRRRFQEVIDHRFYRQKYDSEKAMNEFSASSRNETDLQILAGSMVGVVQHTLQPQSVSVWLTMYTREGAK
jgi:hypothetical protein